MGLVRPGKLSRELYTTRKVDAFFFEGLFEHLDVSSGLPNTCRDRLIQRSAWKKRSAKFAVASSAGPVGA
jgi:hypothetical protein